MSILLIGDMMGKGLRRLVQRNMTGWWIMIDQIAYLKDIDYNALRRGYDLIEMDHELLAWPKCEITYCDNYICVGMSKSLCYPHGIEFKAFTKDQFEENRRNKFK
jgi:hypothetical protein